MSYTEVGWASDGTHPLSQANMKTLDAGLVGTNTIIYEDSPAAATTGAISIPADAVRIEIQVSHRAGPSGLTEVRALLNGRTDGYEGRIFSIDHTGSSNATSVITDRIALGWLGPDTAAGAGHIDAAFSPRGTQRVAIASSGWVRDGTSQRAFQGGGRNGTLEAVTSLELSVGAGDLSNARVVVRAITR